MPVGTYTAETFLIDDKRVLAAATRDIEIGKSGFERFVALAARRQPCSTAWFRCCCRSASAGPPPPPSAAGCKRASKPNFNAFALPAASHLSISGDYTMDEQPDLHQFASELSSFSDESVALAAKAVAEALPSVGRVMEIAGSGSKIQMDTQVLEALHAHADPAVAMSGHVGSQVKMPVGKSWLIANVRTLALGRGRRSHRQYRLPRRRHRARPTA